MLGDDVEFGIQARNVSQIRIKANRKQIHIMYLFSVAFMYEILVLNSTDGKE